MLLDYPGVYLTSMFTPIIFGPVSRKGKCHQYSCRGCSSGEMKMHVSFHHTYFNLLLMGIGSTFALYRLHNIRSLLFKYDWIDLSENYPNQPLTLYIPAFIAHNIHIILHCNWHFPSTGD